jgi:Protein of unknown function (DUF4233)
MSGEPSGLRNPAAAVRGVGSGALVLEALVLLLAIQPLRQFGGETGALSVVVLVVLAVLAVTLTGLLSRPWAWTAGTVLQAAIIATGLLHWSLAAVGLIFALVWAYVLHVRRRVLAG